METIGAKVKKLRLKHKLTLKDLSEKSGLSTGYLSQLERGITTIAVDQLLKISEILGVNINYFFPKTTVEKSVEPVIRTYNQQVLRIFNQCIYKNLSTNPEDKQMMPKLIEIMPSTNQEHLDSYPHQGEEFIYVIEGILTLTFDTQEYQLYPGDSSHYDSTIPHNWSNNTNQMTKFIAVHTPSDYNIKDYHSKQ